MKKEARIITSLLLSLFLLFVAVPAVSAAEYEALKGVKSAKAVFDVRIGQPANAALHLKLIHQTYKDLMTAKKKPHFVVVFIGPSQ